VSTSQSTQSAYPNDSSIPPFAHIIRKEGDFPRSRFIAVFYYQNEITGESFKRDYDGNIWTLHSSNPTICR
jgi:hypothetical protein